MTSPTLTGTTTFGPFTVTPDEDPTFPEGSRDLLAVLQKLYSHAEVTRLLVAGDVDAARVRAGKLTLIDEIIELRDASDELARSKLDAARKV